jgi:hypothetical protein
MVSLKFELNHDAFRLLVASDMYVFLVSAFVYQHRPDPQLNYVSIELSVPIDKLNLVQQQLLFFKTPKSEVTKEEIRMELGSE